MTTNEKGFTLTELLILVAILGILAVVGVPMYEDYQKMAKYNSTLANFNNASSFMSAELNKCGISNLMSLKQSASAGSTDYTPCQVTAATLAPKLVAHFEYDGLKNPYTNENAIITTAPNKGDIQLVAAAGGISITGKAENPKGDLEEDLIQAFELEW